MSKNCNHPTCGEQCRRVKKQKKIYNLKRSPIRRISKKRQQSLGEQKLTQEKDWIFFLNDVWNKREHICFESGEPIYGEPLTIYFHHCLPKSKYPQFRHCAWNIVLVTFETHSKAEINIDFVPKIKKYTASLKRKYLNE